VRQEAHDLMAAIQTRNKAIDPDRQLSIVVEFVAGKVTQTIERLIALYRPDSLIVGSRGQRGMMQTWGAALHVTKVGKVSRWCLVHSPVPVIVVRPERKVKKTMEKRRADPKRSRHFQE
jgi:nucleotide-binding universal stress UspA family protein